MAKKIKLTRPELKRQREALERFERFLPMLKLKQQQLQMRMREVQKRRRAVFASADEAREKFEPYRAVLADRAGIDLESLARPAEVRTSEANVAGVAVPIFEEVEFAEANYSLFGTPAWVDRTLMDMRSLNRLLAEAEILQKQYELLDEELTKIIQRVNLFEKVKIPECQEAIRVIRIKLGDEMTAGVGRAKIAKAKLAEKESSSGMPDYEETVATPGAPDTSAGPESYRT
ncbi:MAG: V-type ATP synthase subunit D [Phycisphaerae bacterium]